MSTKVIIVLEIEGDVGSAHQVVEGALDAGVIQDLIAAHEHDGEPFAIVSATARADALDEDEPAPLAPVGAVVSPVEMDRLAGARLGREYQARKRAEALSAGAISKEDAARLDAADLEDAACDADDLEETGKAKRLRARAYAILKGAGL
jgi:hypothetical protein